MARNRAKRQVYLVRDTREREVAPHLATELATRGVGLVTAQINTADFLICESAGQPGGQPVVRAAFERKTWADLAKGETDLRSLNLGKMLRLRRKEGCQLFFLIEGPAFPAPTRRFGRIPSAHLVTIQTSLMVDHAVFVVPTASPEHTARRLAEFARVISEPDPQATAPAWGGGPEPRVPGALGLPAADGREPAGGPAPPEGPPGGPARPPAPDSAPDAVLDLVVPAGLTAVLEKPENVAAALAWAKLKGVSPAVGGVLACEFSVAELVQGLVPDDRLRQLRGPTGQRLRKDAIQSLLSVRSGAPDAARRLVASVRGFSPGVADQVLSAMNLAALCRAATPEALAALPVVSGGKQARLGPARAARLRRFLHFRATKALGELSFEEKVGAPPGPAPGLRGAASRSRSTPPAPRSAQKTAPPGRPSGAPGRAGPAPAARPGRLSPAELGLRASEFAKGLDRLWAGPRPGPAASDRGPAPAPRAGGPPTGAAPPPSPPEAGPPEAGPPEAGPAAELAAGLADGLADGLDQLWAEFET
jgi:hypothetical protein